MRIILFTGKGGVGKTSVAAATALRCAAQGHRTVVLSTDAAHSLGDSFDVQLSAMAKQIGSNLWAQEVDVFYEVKEHWGTIQRYLTALLAWRGLDEIVAEEMSIFPGMEELASLILITRYHEQSAYDVAVVDCAPTGETLRLLAFPEVAGWWLKNILPIQRRAYQVLRPVVRPFTDMPLPGEDMFDSVKDFLTELGKMHRLLSDPELSSVRLVLNPEKMVIKEAQRTYTYLNLYGYNTDAIVCNRLIPRTVHDSYFDTWKELQERYYQLVEECFTPLPILKVPLFDTEVVGSQMLELMAESIYGTSDAAAVAFHGRRHSVEKVDGGYALSIPLPFITKQEIELTRNGDELIAHIGNHRRNIVLPRALTNLAIKDARLEEGVLRIRFLDHEGPPEAKGQRAAGLPRQKGG